MEAQNTEKETMLGKYRESQKVARYAVLTYTKYIPWRLVFLLFIAIYHYNIFTLCFLCIFLVFSFGPDIYLFVCKLAGLSQTEFHWPKSSREVIEYMVITFSMCPPASIPVLFILSIIFIKQTWFWFIPYVIFIIYDSVPYNGGMKRIYTLRKLLSQYMKSYFPINVLKYDPNSIYLADRPYILGYHPHGLIGFGLCSSFTTTAHDMNCIFPGLDYRVATIDGIFKAPIAREFVIGQGLISVKERSLCAVLERGPGNGVVIIPGGSAETVYEDPNVYQFKCKYRKGIFRLSLKYGCYLVPMLGLGENQIFNIAPWSSKHGKLIKFLNSKLHVELPRIVGVGLFQNDYGFAPSRKPITLLIGKPIACQKVAEPTEAQIVELRTKYFAALTEMHQNFAQKGWPGAKNTTIVFE